MMERLFLLACTLWMFSMGTYMLVGCVRECRRQIAGASDEPVVQFTRGNAWGGALLALMMMVLSVWMALTQLRQAFPEPLE